MRDTDWWRTIKYGCKSFKSIRTGLLYTKEAAKSRTMIGGGQSRVVQELTESSSRPPAVPSDSVSPDSSKIILPAFTDSYITLDCTGWQPITYGESI